MKYGSVPEYFYQLNNRSYFFLLPPVFVTALTIYQTSDASRWALPGPVNAWFYGLLLGTVILLLWVLMGSRSYMQKIRKQISLGERIDQYARLVFYRLGAGAMVGMVAPLFFYMSNDLRFATFMLIFLLWTARFWPGRRRLCDELKLTSSEQEVIMKR